MFVINRGTCCECDKPKEGIREGKGGGRDKGGGGEGTKLRCLSREEIRVKRHRHHRNIKQNSAS